MSIDDARLETLQTVADDRGALHIAETGRHVPFVIKRVFYVNAVAGASRGGHAHAALEEMIVAPRGSFRVRLDDGRGRTREVSLATPTDALYVPPMLWIDIVDLSADALVLVFASDVYDEADYFRDRAAFVRAAGGSA